MRRGRKKFHPDALALLGEVADKYYPALLLLFGDGVDQDNVCAQFHFGLHVKQRAVSIDDDGLAILTEFAADSRPPRGTHRNAGKDAGTSTSRRTGRCGVHEPIVRLTAVRVNSTFRIKCPKCSPLRKCRWDAWGCALVIDISELVRQVVRSRCPESNFENWNRRKPFRLPYRAVLP
jgi:hypothetical protein